MLKRIIVAGIKTGAALSLSTVLAIMASSKHETGDAWNAVNAICHVVDGEEISQPSGFQKRESILGLGLNSAAMFAWSFLYEGALHLTKQKSTPATAIAGSAAAYVIDYHLLTERLKPGIEKKISSNGVFLAYAALALAFGLSPLWNKYQDQDAQ